MAESVVSKDVLADRVAVDSAVDANWNAMLPTFAAMGDPEVVDEDGIVTLCCPKLPYPPINAVNRVDTAGRDADELIEAAVARFPDTVPVCWQVKPGQAPDGLEERLAAHGFEPAETMPILVAAIDDIGVDDARPVPGLEIRPAETESDWQTYTAVGGEAFDSPPDLRDFFGRLVRTDTELGGGSAYIAWLDGEAVATGYVSHRGGISGLYSGGAAPAARGRGVGTAMVLRRIEAARQVGHEVAFMVSGGTAYNMYRRLGFTEAAGPWRLWNRPPKTTP